MREFLTHFFADDLASRSESVALTLPLFWQCHGHAHAGQGVFFVLALEIGPDLVFLPLFKKQLCRFG